MSRRCLAAAICVLALAAARLEASDQKPGAAQSAATPAKSNLPGVAVQQKPDLVVTFEGSGPGLPTGFTVKNIGNGDSKLSVLKVTATWVPPEGGSSGSGGSGCPPFLTQKECDALKAVAVEVTGGNLAGMSGGASSVDLKAPCGNPFPEVLEAVPVLKPGESKTFARDTGPYQISLVGMLRQPGSAQATHIKPCSPILVCAWDVKAVVDASNDNDERNESNNTATRRALREISFK